MTGALCSKESVEDRDLPNTLKDFGYKFEDGKLRNVETGEPFKFVVRENDHTYNQKHYEALGEVITEEVYKLLINECKLKEAPVPTDVKDDEPSTFIFVSEDAFTNPDKLLVFIHGSGVVRAGQWARRLIINDNLESGTQIPFIKEAQKDGYGILVMNTNDNSKKKDRRKATIRGSETPEHHADYVWENYVKKAKAKYIAIIAHSYGGWVTTALFLKHKEDFLKRVFAVAMTDSVHHINHPINFKGMVKISCNWVSSDEPLDTPMKSSKWDMRRVSAGVNVHEKTSWSSFESIFKFLDTRFKAFKNKKDGESKDEETHENQDHWNDSDGDDICIAAAKKMKEDVNGIHSKDDSGTAKHADPSSATAATHSMSDSDDGEKGREAKEDMDCSEALITVAQDENESKEAKDG